MQQRLFSLTNVLDAISEASSKGYRIGFNEIAGPLAMYHPHILAMPPQLSAAIVKLLDSSDAKTLLNPWERFGEVILPILDALPDRSASVICAEPDQFSVLDAMRQHAGYSLVAKLNENTNIDTKFQAIIGIPAYRHAYRGDLGISDGIDSNFLRYLPLLDQGGGAIIVAPRGTFTKAGKQSANAKLNQAGYSVHALFQLSPELRLGAVSVPLDLVVIKEGESQTPGNIFVGAIVSDTAVNDVLITNYLNWQSGSSVELGRILPLPEFVSLEQIIQKEALKSLALEWNCNVVPLAELASNVSRVTDANAISDGPNSIFVPAIGESPVVCSLSDLKITSQNYIRVDLREDLIINEYAAHFLNTQVGKALRNASKAGNFIPKLSNSRLPAIEIPLLSLDIQLSMVNAQSLIANQRAHLAALEATLWQSPRITDQVTRELANQDSFESWAETLPFPLASIAWTYYVADSNRDKVDRLIHFFEATAEFLATLFLSAYSQNPDLYAANCDQWITRSDDGYQKKFIKSSFGAWAILCSKLASAVRKLLKTPDNESTKLLLHFLKADQEFLDALLNKGIYTLLNDVVEKRNSWLGHTGLTSDEQSYRRRIVLESDMAKLRELLGPRFKKAQLILPGVCRFSQGQYFYKAKLIQGTHSEFRTIDVCTSAPMDEGNLYFLYEQSQNALKMLPFVKLCPGPSTQNNACYFYNRTTSKDEARFVSYHFSDDPEIQVTDDSINRALDLLRHDYGLDSSSSKVN